MQKPMESVEMGNRCRLDIYDKSVKMAADRWKVRLVAQLVVPVDERFFVDGLEMPASLEELRLSMGSEIVFEMVKERVFVDDRDRAAVFEALQDTFKKDSMPYLARNTFPGKYLIKCYREKVTDRP